MSACVSATYVVFEPVMIFRHEVPCASTPPKYGNDEVFLDGLPDRWNLLDVRRPRPTRAREKQDESSSLVRPICYWRSVAVCFTEELDQLCLEASKRIQDGLARARFQIRRYRFSPSVPG